MNRQATNQTYYQKNKLKITTQKKLKYQQDKPQTKTTKPITSAPNNQYYSAKSIKILPSFKEYMELSKDKQKKLWCDFNWTLQDCQSAIQEGLGDITAIMKLEQVANNLIRDYWTTAKSEEKQRSRNWNSLSDEEQQRLIKYWGKEKARIENGFIAENERLEIQGKQHQQEIELAKFHEQKGIESCLKGNNPCYSCEERKIIQQEIKSKVFGYAKQSNKEQCPECGNSLRN
ncbi:MAG: hypothetical protein GBAus27B_000252 [Mycoplasmataceae bacterium]|nr:MAG: hypothetical protein GBAus27B_000252 [Mycoplasmataceae bacterium]